MTDTSSQGTMVAIIVILAIIGLVVLRRLAVRFVINLLANSTGRTVIGILLCLGGLIFGFTSGYTPYQSLSQNSMQLLIPHVNTPDDGDIYLQSLSNLGANYVIHDADYSPPVSASTFQNGAGITSLLYDSINTQSIQMQFTSNYGSSAPMDGGTGYTVEQFTLNGTTYSTAAYLASPSGVYQNHWLLGGGIAGAGLLLLVITFGIPALSKRWETEAPATKASPDKETWSIPVSTPPAPGAPHTPHTPYTPTPQPGGSMPMPGLPTPQPGGFMPPPYRPPHQSEP